MEYIVELRFEDRGYNAVVHFMATFVVQSERDAQLFVDELIAGIKRNGITIFFYVQYNRLDNNPQLKARMYEYYQFYKSRATASIKIEQYLLENPDQTKSLAENLSDCFFNGEDCTAMVGPKYNIPVRVTDKSTGNTIAADIFYSTVEHLIPKD